MRFGLTLPVKRLVQSAGETSEAGEGFPPLVALVQRAEALGYDSIAVGDHIVVPTNWVPVAGEAWYDPFTLLGYISAVTRRVRLLTDALVLPYRNPFTVAKAVATLDQLSGGRMLFGAAPGFLESEFQALRVPFAERGPMSDEYLQLLKALWSQEEPQFQGRYYTFSGVKVSPKPVQRPHPPIWIGGNSRRAVRRAVEQGNGWLPFSLSPQELQEGLAYARELMRSLRIDKTLEVAAHLSRVEVSDQRSGKARRPLSGTAQQVADDVESYRHAGATYGVVSFGGSTLAEHEEQMERFASEVMLRFREGWKSSGIRFSAPQ
jgi:probable F420-dependent oxidoreductase